MGLLHEELTYKIRGLIFDVQNTLGIGYNEDSYHIALTKGLKNRNISFQSKEVRYVMHRGQKVKKFIADLIIEDKIILELKNIQTDFHPNHHLQIISYLKCWEKDLGILVNFGMPRGKMKRVPFTPKEPVLIENYENINPLLNSEIRSHLQDLRHSIINILSFHGLGYGASVYSALLIEELSNNKIPFSQKNIIPLKFENEIIQHFELKHPIIDNNILCYVSALQEGISNDIAKLEMYLKDLNLAFGIIVHFGKKQLELIGVCNPTYK